MHLLRFQFATFVKNQFWRMLRFTSSTFLKGLAFRYGTNKKSHYQILETSPSATQQQIKAKYYSLVKKYHPDVSKLHQDHIKIINEAYSVLSDPNERAKYDRDNGFTLTTRSESDPYSNVGRGDLHQNYDKKLNEDERMIFRSKRRMRARSNNFPQFFMENFIIGMIFTAFFILIFGIPSNRHQNSNKNQRRYGKQQFQRDFQNSLMRSHSQQ